MKTLLIIIATIIGLLIAYLLLLKFASAKMQKVATEFLDFIRDADIENAHELMADAFRVNHSIEEFNQYLFDQGIYEIDSIKRNLGDYSIGTVAGTVTPILVRSDNIWLNVHLELIYEYEKYWKVFSIKVMQVYGLDEEEESS